MIKLIDNIKENSKLIIKGKEYVVLTKTWYSILEDPEIEYVKCELTNNKILVLIPNDNLVYIGSIINNLKYERINENKITYNSQIYNKTGEGHQYIKKIDFGNADEVEGNCIFEDYESDNHIISLGILSDSEVLADVYADILKLEEINI